MKVSILQYNPSRTLSKAIAWFTRGVYCHSAIAFFDVENGGDMLVEAHIGQGVINRFFKLENENCDVYEFVTPPTEEQVNAMFEFALNQVGKKYDSRMVSAFVTRKTQESRKSKGRWFCSELVFAIVAKALIYLFKNTEPWEVSPDLIKRSTLLRKVR